MGDSSKPPSEGLDELARRLIAEVEEGTPTTQKPQIDRAMRGILTACCLKAMLSAASELNSIPGSSPEDAVQECLIKFTLMLQEAGFRQRMVHGNPVGYLCIMARNKARDLLDAHYTRMDYLQKIKTGFASEQRSPPESLESRQIVEHILSKISKEIDRELVYKVCILEKTSVEVGLECGLTSANVRQRVGRALTALRQNMEQS